MATFNHVVVLNKIEWEHDFIFKWSKREIREADEQGFIGRKFGIDCYLARPLDPGTVSFGDH